MTARLDLQLLAESTENGSPVLKQNFFKSAIWTPDGTSVITGSEDNRIDTYIMYVFLCGRC